MDVKDFYYDLPEELIAQDPLEKRDSSRMLVLHRDTGEIEHREFHDVLEYLNPGDCLVINDTRVIPARLYGEKEDTGAAIEVLLLKEAKVIATSEDEASEGDNASEDTAGKNVRYYECLVRPGKKMKPGARVAFGKKDENGKALLIGEVIKVVDDGNRIIRFEHEGIWEEILDALGEMPLPPYITHKLQDKNRYQTVYAKHDGSAAAPTAGLHFTDQLLKDIEAKGIKIARLTLHVGLGTFRPVKVEKIEEHHMHSEYYELSQETADIINETKKNGGRVISVGTTSTRTLETVAQRIEAENPELAGGKLELKASSGWTDIFIYPGYRFRVVDLLITNFHLPESTLIMLVSAFYNREAVLDAYKTAVEDRYRFFSFGDAMLIL